MQISVGQAVAAIPTQRNWLGQSKTASPRRRCDTDDSCCCSKKPEPRPSQRVRMTLKEQRGCNGFDDELANLNLELMPLASRVPDFTPLRTEAICCVELPLASNLHCRVAN